MHLGCRGTLTAFVLDTDELDTSMAALRLLCMQPHMCDAADAHFDETDAGSLAQACRLILSLHTQDYVTGEISWTS